VEVEVSDQEGGSVVGTYEYVTVYDPDGGYVSGSGAILSPEGACTWKECVSDEGTARFGFSSRYRQGATTPDGKTRFTFRDGNFTFRSTAYQWLTIAGARAQYKGEGTVNRGGNYGFMLTGIDSDRPGGGGEDRFRIKIWDRDDADKVVYDNQAGAEDDADLAVEGTRLTRGSITIRTSTANQTPVVIITSPADGATFIEHEEILLAADAGDAEDGDLSAAVAWSSDLAGALGVGASVPVASLQPGSHIITASVTDSKGLTGGSSVTLHVHAAGITVDDATVKLRERNGLITESDDVGPYCQAIDLSALVSSDSGITSGEMAYRVTSLGETGALFPDEACAEGTELSHTDFESGAAVDLSGTTVWYAPPLDVASIITGDERLDGAWFKYQASPSTDVWSADGTVGIAVLSTDNDVPRLAWSTSACPEDGSCEIYLLAVDPDPADTHTFTITDINTPGLSTLHHYDETKPGNAGERITSGTLVPDGRLVYLPAPNFFGEVANLFAASVEDQGGLVRSGYFAPWVDNHLHLGFRPRDGDAVRASGSLPLELGVAVEPVAWDGTGTVVETGETHVVLDTPGHPAPGDGFAGIAASVDAGDSRPERPLDGGLAHYAGAGLFGGGDGPVSLLDATVGEAAGGLVTWADVEVRANGTTVHGLSLGAFRDRLGAKLVSWDGPPAALGEPVDVTIETR
jgi:hypothetical protein